MARTIDDQPSIQEARCSGVAAIDGDPTPRYTVDKLLVDLAGTVVARRLLVRCHFGSQVSVVQPAGTSRDVDIFVVARIPVYVASCTLRHERLWGGAQT